MSKQAVAINKDVNLAYELSYSQGEFYFAREKAVALVTGYGGGKSFIAFFRCVMEGLHIPGIRLAFYSTTYDLLMLNIIPRFVEFLETINEPYTLNKSDKIIYIHSTGAQIIFRSLDNPDRLIGYEVCKSYFDELDTMDTDKAQDVWRKGRARNRQKLYYKGRRVPNQMFVTTTPEGYKFVYKKFGKNDPANEDYDPDVRLIQGSSRENIHLPEDYIADLIKDYPSQLVEAYINGQFVNLTSGAVYYAFNRVDMDVSNFHEAELKQSRADEIARLKARSI